MIKENKNKYKPFQPIDIKNRKWPNSVIKKAPIWCSVDLRDGNQALIEPMDIERKMKLFKTLVDIGLKEIEVGFPSASQTDFDFVRGLIEGNHIPDDVYIQVLTQSRKDLIDKTFESFRGAKKVILHLYNSTSELQRRVVFGQDKEGVKKIATDGAKIIANNLENVGDTTVRLMYSPESFTGTELPYALEVCESVLDVWGVDENNPIIINLPATVEMSTPNIYADQIEWMHSNFSNRNRIILSVHTHNDRGTGVAATEFGIMAGAQRVEGTLFGNGERTGNVCLVTLALNLFTQGINPKLNFSNINKIIEVVEYCNKLPINYRHPYAGRLVHTAFSGSHQDAIRKGMIAWEKSDSELWEVPYLPIDPTDIGRTYEDIIRVNSQSGKGGSAWLLESEHHIHISRAFQIEFSNIVQEKADKTGKEITSDEIWNIFSKEYLKITPWALTSFSSQQIRENPHKEKILAKIVKDGKIYDLENEDNGPISAFVSALCSKFNIKLNLKDFGENTRSQTSKAEAAAYVELELIDNNGNSKTLFGCGIDTSITNAPIKAILSALNRL